MNEGWKCPECGAINAPWVPQCPCGGAKIKIDFDETDTDIDEFRQGMYKCYICGMWYPKDSAHCCPGPRTDGPTWGQGGSK